MTARTRLAGFTLAELLITVAVLGVLTGLLIQASARDWRRERVNGVVVELAGWLETVRRSALRGHSCSVTLPAGGAPLLASASNCGNVPPLRLPGLTDRPPVVVTSSAAGNSFSFTPAGTLHPAPDEGSPIVITVRLADDPDPSRCLQLDGLLGVIDVGHANAGACVRGRI